MVLGDAYGADHYGADHYADASLPPEGWGGAAAASASASAAASRAAAARANADAADVAARATAPGRGGSAIPRPAAAHARAVPPRYHEWPSAAALDSYLGAAPDEAADRGESGRSTEGVRSAESGRSDEGGRADEACRPPPPGSLSERLRRGLSRRPPPHDAEARPPPAAPPAAPPVAPPHGTGWPPRARGEREPPSEFALCVADAVCRYLWRFLPVRAAAAASTYRHGRGREPLISSLRFCIETDSAGTPLEAEPLRQIELWCLLAGWGLVHIGAVPVSYDRRFRCIFPDIAEAVLHRVPRVGPPASAASEPGGYLVSLAIKDERGVIAVAEELLARHVPGLA